MDPTSQPKKQQPIKVNDSLVEQMRDLGRGVGKTIARDLVGGIAQDALSSLFGTPKSGNLKPGQGVNLTQPTAPKPNEVVRNPARLPFMPERFPFPFRKKEQPKPMFTQEQMNHLRAQESQVAQKIEEIRMELKALVSEIQAVNSEIQRAVTERVIDGGQYHMSFFDRLKVILKLALQEMKESRSWLNTQSSRKKQKSYWAQYKKKGTTFGLSHERSVATQVG
jgi:hypothetical protein